MQHYSAIEFSMNELLIRASLHEKYQNYSGVPFSFKDKLRRVIKLFEADGPLKSYYEKIIPTIKYLEEKVNERNLIVHGWMNYKFVSPFNGNVEFILYAVSRDKQNSVNVTSTEKILFTDKQLESASGELRDIVDMFVGNVIELSEAIPLPEIRFAENDFGISTGILRRRFTPI